MSGRDCIGIAKTGSGKTLAFVLPLLRHIRDQPALKDGEGPIGLIMAPTRELVQQIAKVRRCVGLRAVGCRAVCCAVCCAVLCCALLCRAVLCRAALCCAVLCCAVLCCAVLCCAVLCCAVLCCAVLCCASALGPHVHTALTLHFSTTSERARHTHPLAQEVRRLGSCMLISCTPVFGGAGVGHQISELKRGTEVRVAACVPAWLAPCASLRHAACMPP
jgi:hypothetical protein